MNCYKLFTEILGYEPTSDIDHPYSPLSWCVGGVRSFDDDVKIELICTPGGTLMMRAFAEDGGVGAVCAVVYTDTKCGAEDARRELRELAENLRENIK